LFKRATKALAALRMKEGATRVEVVKGMTFLAELEKRGGSCWGARAAIDGGKSEVNDEKPPLTDAAAPGVKRARKNRQGDA